jgi:hypothetical protein
MEEPKIFFHDFCITVMKICTNTLCAKFQIISSPRLHGIINFIAQIDLKVISVVTLFIQMGRKNA